MDRRSRTSTPRETVRAALFMTPWFPSLTLAFFFFFFQAEDGIRDSSVTGVQTWLFRSLAAHQSRTENADSHAAPLSIDQLLQVFRVPFPLHRDLSRRVVDLVEIVGRKFDGSGSDVLFETMQLGCTRDGPNPRLLRNHPVKRDLSRCRLLSFCNLAQQITQR